MNASQPLSYDLNERPMRLAGITTPSGLPSIVPYPNGSRTSFASRPSKPPTTGTRRSLPRLTNVTGKTAAKTRRPGPLGTPPVTPTGRPEQLMASDPQSPLTLLTPHPASLWAKESPTPTDPRGSAHPPSSTPLTSMTPQYPWIPTLTIATTSWTPPTIKKPYAQTESRTACGSTCWRKRRRNNGRRARASYVVSRDTLFAVVLNDRKQVGSLGLEDALDHGPYPNVFSAPATLLHAMILTPDNPPAHLPSHSSTNLLLHATLPFTDKPVPTLVNSGATNNFVDKSLVALAPQPLRRLPAPIPLKLFDGDSTPAGDITHCLETTLTFTDGQQQELRLLITKLHPSAPVILGFSWLRSTNPHINWPSLTLCLNWDNPTNSGLVPFNVSPPSENSKTTINQPRTLPQLRSRSARSFVIYVQLGGSLKVLPALVDSGASSVFISNQLDLQRNDLDKPLELQLFDRSPAMTRIMQYYDNTLTLDNNLQLLWLQDVNPDINWKNLTMQFPGPKASLAAAIHLRFQSISDLDVTLDLTVTPTVPNPVNSGNLDIKIIGAVPFACLLREGTPAFQLQVTPALPEEYLHAGNATPESKTEEQILSEVVPPEYHEFADMFSKGSAKELPPHRSYDHQINLEEGTSPPFGKIYNMSKIELRALKEYLNNMLGKGFIRPSISAAGTPVLDSVWTIGDSTNAKIYTKIDLRSGYNNVWIAPGHEWKTAFCTRYGLFEYLVMPFKMTNSPATFQYFMNNIFHNMNDIFVIIYLDDILIYLNSPAEHLEHVRRVLELLREYHLHAKPKKCSFHTAEVKYLRVIVTPNSVRMDPAKVDAILNWPSPRNVKEVQSFLGFANFYRCFIDNYSGITKPLNRLTWKDTPWDWDSKCQSVFLLLKKAFTSALVLCHFDPSLLIVLQCDPSNYAIAGILSQSNSEGKDLHPIAFYTRSMIPAELNYNIYNKELLAIVEAFRQWRAYLEGSPHRIQVYSNHNNLQYFTTTKQLSRPQAQ
ncbi:hypothetical protein E4T56_gene12784 [Termitomyces sp. T112]|nr:hypothetical protein E4T56_gene12784 [Termitomyces sp. T112]